MIQGYLVAAFKYIFLIFSHTWGCCLRIDQHNFESCNQQPGIGAMMPLAIRMNLPLNLAPGSVFAAQLCAMPIPLMNGWWWMTSANKGRSKMMATPSKCWCPNHHFFSSRITRCQWKDSPMLIICFDGRYKYSKMMFNGQSIDGLRKPIVYLIWQICSYWIVKG